MCFQSLCVVTSNLSQLSLFLLWCYESKCHQHCLYSSGKVEQTRSLCVCVCVYVTLVCPCMWVFSHTSAKADCARSAFRMCVCVHMHIAVHKGMSITTTTNKSHFRQSVGMGPHHLKVRYARSPWTCVCFYVCMCVCVSVCVRVCISMHIVLCSYLYENQISLWAQKDPRSLEVQTRLYFQILFSWDFFSFFKF